MEKYTTLGTKHIHLLAEVLSKAVARSRTLSALEPITDFEELLTFAEANPTPIEFTPQHPAWRLESVAARIIEAVAIAAHEPLSESEYRKLARILLAHTEYLYAYPTGEPRPRLEAGSALALAGCVCASLPQSELWQLAGFGRLAGALAEVAPAPTDVHLILPIDLAFSLANECNLSILKSAVTIYNTLLKRNFTPRNQYQLPLSDNDFFRLLNSDFPGMEDVKAAILADDISAAKSAYTTFRSQFLKDYCKSDTVPLERSDTYATAKTYLECLLRLSIHPMPAITTTTEIGIATHLFPEFRGSEQLFMLALRRYKWIANTSFHADGFHKDRTLRSQVAAITDFVRFLSVYGEPAEHTYDLKELRALLEKLTAACLHLSQPDLCFPPLGPLPAPNLDAAELCTMVDSNFRREDFSCSHALPETGCYVMRDSWKPDAQYLFLDIHPSEVPSHADTSKLMLYAHGQQLITGSVGIVGTTLSASDGIDTQWITAPAFDWVEKWHHAANSHHKRAIFYLKGKYFILHDLLLGNETQTLEQIFRFDRDVKPHITADAGYTWTHATRGSNLFIGVTEMTDLTVTLDRDSVIYRSNKASPAVLNTLLFPMQPGVKTYPTLSDISVNTDADVLATGFTVQLPNTTDTLLISDDGLAEMAAADITFVGEYLFLRRNASGGVQFIIFNGRFLKVGAKVLIDFAEPRESYVQM